MWTAAMTDAAQAPLRAAAAKEIVTGTMLVRQDHAGRLAATLRTALREVDGLIESALRLKRVLEQDGVGALTGGNNFEAEARAVADALVTLKVQREAFGAAEGAYRREEKTR